MPTLYKVKPVQLHTGHYPGEPQWKYPIDIDPHPGGDEGIEGPPIQHSITTPSPADHADAELVSDLIASQPKSGVASPLDLIVSQSKPEPNLVLLNPFIPDHLFIFILVYDKDELETAEQNQTELPTWENINDAIEIENDILELGILRMGFDEEPYEFNLEDITIKVVNDTYIWDTILSRDTLTEIRIVVAQPRDEAYNTAYIYENMKGLFYGVIDKDSITFDDNQNDRSLRKYEFTALNYLSILKEVSISDLRNALENDTPDFLTRDEVLVGIDEWERLPEDQDTGRIPQLTYACYFTIVNIFRHIFKLIFPLQSIEIKSDTYFTLRDDTAGWYLNSIEKSTQENICILAYKKLFADWNQLGEYQYGGTFFDDTEGKIPEYSFFQYENCASLLKELLISFGLLWYANYSVLSNIRLWKFQIDFTLTTRFLGKLVDLNANIHNDVKGIVKIQESNGVIIDVPRFGSTTNYVNANIRPSSSHGVNDETRRRGYAVPNDKMKNLITPFVSFQGPNAGSEQCIYGVKNNTMRATDKYVVQYGNKTETYPNRRWRSSEEDDKLGHPNEYYGKSDKAYHKLFFAEMVANYYAGQYGIYKNLSFDTLNFTVDTLDINPLDKLYFNDKLYIIMRTEKDILKGSSKIEIREYREYTNE